MSKQLKLYTGETLKRWDGTTPFIKPHLYYNCAAESELYYDTEYNIYYFEEGNPNPLIWCTAARLTTHIVKLFQIKNR